MNHPIFQIELGRWRWSLCIRARPSCFTRAHTCKLREFQRTGRRSAESHRRRQRAVRGGRGQVRASRGRRLGVHAPAENRSPRH